GELGHDLVSARLAVLLHAAGPQSDPLVTYPPGPYSIPRYLPSPFIGMKQSLRPRPSAGAQTRLSNGGNLSSRTTEMTPSDPRSPSSPSMNVASRASSESFSDRPVSSSGEYDSPRGPVWILCCTWGLLNARRAKSSAVTRASSGMFSMVQSGCCAASRTMTPVARMTVSASL